MEYATFRYDTAEVENGLNGYFRNYRIRQELSFIFFHGPLATFLAPLRKRWHVKFKNSKHRAARVLTSASYDTSTDFLQDKLGWKYLKTQRKIVKGTMVYKALNGLAPNYLAQMFTERSRITNYTLRDTSDKLALPLPRTNYMKNSFSYHKAELWNSLPIEVQREFMLYLNLRRTAATLYTYITALVKTRCNIQINVCFISIVYF